MEPGDEYKKPIRFKSVDMDKLYDLLLDAQELHILRENEHISKPSE